MEESEGKKMFFMKEEVNELITSAVDTVLIGGGTTLAIAQEVLHKDILNLTHWQNIILYSIPFFVGGVRIWQTIEKARREREQRILDQRIKLLDEEIKIETLKKYKSLNTVMGKEYENKKLEDLKRLMQEKIEREKNGKN